jgi:hypothetical protein
VALLAGSLVGMPVFTATVLLGSALTFAACSEKEEGPIDPKAELKAEYVAMQVDSAKKAQDIKYLTDVELANFALQPKLKSGFWTLAVSGPPFPVNFADSVAGIHLNPDTNVPEIIGGYIHSAKEIISASGPSGSGTLMSESIDLLERIIEKSESYLDFLPLIAAKREELSKEL